MSPQESDKKIIEDCISGNRNAQYSLYKMYSKSMYNICLRMIKDRDDAEDVLQNSFVDVFAKLRMFKFESTPGAWIKRIVINNCINHLRKNRLTLKPLDEQFEFVDETSVGENVELNISGVKKAIESLPDGYRVVFSLYAMEGYDHGEIAEIMNISESTSKSQYSRARAKIYEQLRASGEINNIYN